ncbi:MAG: OmpA family protein [Bacteroidales bacterium]
MTKNALRYLMLLVLFPTSLFAQEIKTDTIRVNRQETIAMDLGDPNDVVTVGSSAASNWFVSLAGGVDFLAAEANRKYDNFYQRFRPVGQLSVGKWFTPALGLRFQFGVGRLEGHSYPYAYFNTYDQIPDHTIVPSEALPYISEKNNELWFNRKFTYMDFQLNLMTDVVQWFTNEEKRVGVYLFAGPGFSKSFKNQGISGDHSFALKAGAQLDVKISDKWSFLFEMQGTVVDESFNGQLGGYSSSKNRTLEGYGAFTAGLTYKFGGKRFNRYTKVDPIVLETAYFERPVEIEEVEVVEEDMTVPFIVRFYIDKYNIEANQVYNIFKVAKYLQDNPQANLQLSGYADRETAYPAYNLKLSQRRVNAVKNYIVKNYGIDPARITTAALGDKERLYNEDYRWNRAVVMQIVEP